MTSVLTGLLGTLIGLFLGNRFALGRDRRKEFNEISAPIYENLEKQRIIAIGGNFPGSANDLNASSFISLIRVTPSYRVKALKHAISNYDNAKQNCGIFTDGIYDFNNPDVLLKAIEQLQKFTPHK
ncbi:hypothetical protein [Vibrio metschnikovii]|uniref:hypothetical protein n=1 Tax=Vibrio metschnikovii TaxID=28172 RepID=UPI001C30F2FB|nr:hypothetical protein [Vibrio metschnikovii]